MASRIFINLPVRDLDKSTAFYEALGFRKNSAFSDENASGMEWSDTISVMLLKHDFYKKFIREKTVANSHGTSAVLLALSMDSKEAVQQFAETAKAHGGDYFTIETGVPEEMMFGYEALDPDGHQWEPLWMNPEFNPSQPNDLNEETPKL